MQTFADTTIEVHGVVLRPFLEADIPSIVAACSDPLTQRWLPLPSPYTDSDARAFAFEIAPRCLASGQGIQRAIEVDGRFAGTIGLKSTDWAAQKTEAGYWLGPWARGRGIMARALAALTDWALDSQGMGRVQVLVAPGNHASSATAQRAFFIREGLLCQAGFVHAGLVDLIVFSRLTDDPRPVF